MNNQDPDLNKYLASQGFNPVDFEGYELNLKANEKKSSKVPTRVEIPNRVEDIYPLTIIKTKLVNTKNIIIFNLPEDSGFICEIDNEFPEEDLKTMFEDSFPNPVFYGIGKTIEEAFQHYLENINVYLVAYS